MFLFRCSTYDKIWQDAMAELNEQIHIEDDTLDMEPGEKRPAVSAHGRVMWFGLCVHRLLCVFALAGDKCDCCRSVSTLRVTVHQVPANLPEVGDGVRQHAASAEAT